MISLALVVSAAAVVCAAAMVGATTDSSEAAARQAERYVMRGEDMMYPAEPSCDPLRHGIIAAER